MLENLEPAKKIDAPKDFRPGLEFDGNEGVATTEALPEPPNFDDFLAERGYSPDEYEVVGTPRTSQWQRWDGQWLTAYRFHFRRKVTEFDLPTLYAEVKKTAKAKPASKARTNDKVFVIAPADFQVGKVGSRGSAEELIARIFASYNAIEAHLKKHKYDRIVILDMGDIIEGVSNKADMQQVATNFASPMQQVDLAAALIWDLLKIVAKYAPVTYGSVASNHCQYRVNKQQVGKPGQDDWGIVILQQLRRLASETNLPVDTWLIPQPEDEGFAYDVFGDGLHVLGAIHGHQVNRPDSFPQFWKGQVFGSSYLAAVTVMVSGHFHHCRVQELGGAPAGGSRWWIQASTSDNGSDWYRLTTGEDSDTAITCFELTKGVPFKGEVKLF
jgi:hypothetical protein